MVTGSSKGRLCIVKVPAAVCVCNRTSPVRVLVTFTVIGVVDTLAKRIARTVVGLGPVKTCVVCTFELDTADDSAGVAVKPVGDSPDADE